MVRPRAASGQRHRLLRHVLFPILKEIAQKPLIPLIMGFFPSLVQ